MDLEIMEKLLEDMNQQTNQLIDLVRGLRKGEVFGEPLTATQKTRLATLAKTRYNTLVATQDTLIAEMNK